MTMNPDLNRLRAETAAVAMALLAVLEPEKRRVALNILQIGDDIGGTTNGVLAMLKEMIGAREDELPEVRHD